VADRLFPRRFTARCLCSSDDRHHLDITPLGRQETWEDSPEGYPQDLPYQWWNWHDNYEAEPSAHPLWVDILTDPEGAAARRRAGEEKGCKC